MSENDHTVPEENGRLAAAEYVLGVLPAEERRTLEQRIAQEPELARDIAFWEERLGGIADSIPPVTPPADAWARIEAAVAAPAAGAPAVTTPRAPGLWDNLNFWRAFGISAAALVLINVAAVFYIARAPAPRAPLMASLGQQSGQPGFVAAISTDGASLTIVPAALLASDQRAYQLWLIPAGGKPHSLGLIAPGKPMQISVPRELIPQVQSGATLAVSAEPPGGSPTGQPTGPVIAHGNLTSL
ncbi:MAG: anti-sigma factor [Xanthobacteraceae bacterium]